MCRREYSNPAARQFVFLLNEEEETLIEVISSDTARSSIAFRLPKELLASIDLICNEFDLTRSQLFRRSVTEFIKTLGHERNAQPLSAVPIPKQEERKWSAELYHRLERRR